MKAYRSAIHTMKIEVNNCLIIVTEQLLDTKGRNVTSIHIIPDNYIGEHKNIRIGSSSNIRVVTLKKKNI